MLPRDTVVRNVLPRGCPRGQQRRGRRVAECLLASLSSPPSYAIPPILEEGEMRPTWRARIPTHIAAVVISIKPSCSESHKLQGKLPNSHAPPLRERNDEDAPSAHQDITPKSGQGAGHNGIQMYRVTNFRHTTCENPGHCSDDTLDQVVVHVSRGADIVPCTPMYCRPSNLRERGVHERA